MKVRKLNLKNANMQRMKVRKLNLKNVNYGIEF